jgi:hypothetical protein
MPSPTVAICLLAVVCALRGAATARTTELFPKGGHSWPLRNVDSRCGLNLTLVKALDPAQTSCPLASCPKL